MTAEPANPHAWKTHAMCDRLVYCARCCAVQKPENKGGECSVSDTDVHKFIGRVNWDPANDKKGLKRAFDEIVASNVNIHIEFLDDDSCWMSITDPHGDPDDRQIVTFQATGRGKLIGRTGAE